MFTDVSGLWMFMVLEKPHILMIDDDWLTHAVNPRPYTTPKVMRNGRLRAYCQVAVSRLWVSSHVQWELGWNWCVCMYVCMHACMHACMYIYIYILYTSINICILHIISVYIYIKCIYIYILYIHSMYIIQNRCTYKFKSAFSWGMRTLASAFTHSPPQGCHFRFISRTPWRYNLRCSIDFLDFPWIFPRFSDVPWDFQFNINQPAEFRLVGNGPTRLHELLVLRPMGR